MNFNNIISTKPFTEIHQLCVQQNIEAHVIGGFVRDLILGQPSKDIDIVVVGKSGIEFAQLVVKAFGTDYVSLKVFKNFGTAQIIAHGIEFEFVGARKESYNRASRKPIVENGTLSDDQHRRDFTINTLSIDLRTGELHNPFNGIRDLHDGVIRTPIDSNQTFSDDPLRQLRAIRFAAQFNFKIATSVITSIIKNVNRLDIVSSERIIAELNKIMLTDNPSYGIRLMNESRLLQKLLPEVTALKGVDTVDDFKHKDNFEHTLSVLDQTVEKSSNIVLRWAALLHDIGKARTKRFDSEKGFTFHNHERIGAYMLNKIANRLKIGTSLKNKISKLVLNHGRPKELVKNGVSDAAIRRLVVDLGDQLDDLLLFVTCDITTRYADRRERLVKQIDDLIDRIHEIEERDNLRNFKVPITGEEIMAEFNLKPSKNVGLIKSAIKDAILNGECENNKKAANIFMHTVAKRLLS